MIAVPERSPERDAAIEAMLPNVPFDGWTWRAMRNGLASIGAPVDDAELLFPGGIPDMLDLFFDLADRRMEEAASAERDRSLSARVRAVIALRLAQNRQHKEAIRRALALMSLRRHARLAARCTARTVDAIWHAAGDRSADFSWYTKRVTLGAIYSATNLYWLSDTSEDDAATLAFVDRRLRDLGVVHRMRSKASGLACRSRRAA
jgi:ubiquinone biosynthesis protein COQ9